MFTVIGDSKAHWLAAPTGPEHYFNRTTRFANLGIAADEPIMANLRPYSPYTPEFYGVSGSGGSTGTTGPIGESLILADGESRNFTGAFETLGLWYEQKSGAGTLTVSRGGTILLSVSAAGAVEHDKFSGQIATGSTASETYTFAASGGPVEITALLRLGVKTSTTRQRLRTFRMAHGGYAFGSFTADRLASGIKIAQYAGGKMLPILSLGTNDSFQVTPATMVANATTVIDSLVAAGVDRIYAIMPQRPSPAGEATYTGGKSYDGAMGPLRKLYRQKGVIVIPTDHLDFVGRGEFNDALHENGLGNDTVAQILIEALAA